MSDCAEKEISDEAKSEDARLQNLSGIEELPDFEDLVAKGGVKELKVPGVGHR